MLHGGWCTKPCSACIRRRWTTFQRSPPTGRFHPTDETFRFRINPNAKFSDGMPVTSDDVVASWKLVVDKGLQDPANNLIFSNFETAGRRKQIHRVGEGEDRELAEPPVFRLRHVHLSGSRSQERSTAPPTSATTTTRCCRAPVRTSCPNRTSTKAIRSRSPAARTTGPSASGATSGYTTSTRFSRLVVRDRNLEFERFKRGDIDYYFVQRAQMWVQELNYPNIKRGLNQKRKIFNHNPQGVQGVAMNTRREPLQRHPRPQSASPPVQSRADDPEADVQRIYSDGFDLPGAASMRTPATKKSSTTRSAALQLLAEAGWKDRDSTGRLTKDGQAAEPRDRLSRSGVRAIFHGLSGRSPQSRHHAESAARHLGNPDQAHRR